MGIVAATGCNTVYGSTYPFNPYLVPWTNSLFENAPAVAHGHPRPLGPGGPPGAPAVGHGRRRGDVRHRVRRAVPDGRLRADIKVLVLDTQVYSNTGGQASTASFGGQVTKLSAFGKAIHGRNEPRKELGRILMAHGEAYVAQSTPAHLNHFLRTIMEANAFPGPAVVIAYTPCQPEHGIADDASAAAVEAGRRVAHLPALHLRPAPRRDASPSGSRSRATRPCGATGRRAPDGTPDRLPGLRPDGGPVRPALRTRTGRRPTRSSRRPRTGWPTGGRSRSSPASRSSA